MALSALQRHHRRWPRLWPGCFRLQGPAHRPVDGHAPAETQRHPIGGQPGPRLRRRRGARRPLRLRLAGRQLPGEAGRSLRRQRGRRHAHRSGGQPYLRPRRGRKGTPPDRDRHQGHQRPRLGALAEHQRHVPLEPGVGEHRGLRAGAGYLHQPLRLPVHLRHRGQALPGKHRPDHHRG